jgi:hypothetical protein
MTERIVFLEFIDEVDAYLALAGSQSGANRLTESTTIIALSMSVQVALKKNNIPYLDTLSFFDNDSHSHALNKSEEWLQQIEAFMGKNMLLTNDLTYMLRLIISYLLWLSEVTSRAIESLKPKTICFADIPISLHQSKWMITGEDRFLSGLLTHYAEEKGVTVEHFPLSLSRNWDNDRFHEPSLFTQDVKHFFQKFTRTRRILLGATTGYNMEKVIKTLSEEDRGSVNWTRGLLEFEPPRGWYRYIKRLVGLRWKYFSKKQEHMIYTIPVWAFPFNRHEVLEEQNSLDQKLESLADQLETVWREDFYFNEMDLGPVIAMKLRAGILYQLKKRVRRQLQMREMLQVLQPEIVVSPIGAELFSTLGQQCKELGIPAVIIPHGTLAAPEGALEEIEWRRLSQGQLLSPYGFAAAQTPIAAEHAAYYGAEKRTINTGPIVFARTCPGDRNLIRQKLNLADDVALVCYAAAQRKRSSMRFHIFETEDEYLSAMADLVEAVNRMEKTHLVIKLHPSSEFTDEQMRHHLPASDRLTILHREPFAHVLAAADILVSYISTTVEEALLNRVPVVLYDKWNRFRFVKAFNCNGVPEQRWGREAAYYSSEPDTLDRLLYHALEQNRDKKAAAELYRKYSLPEKEIFPLLKHVRERLKTLNNN